MNLFYTRNSWFSRELYARCGPEAMAEYLIQLLCQSTVGLASNAATRQKIGPSSYRLDFVLCPLAEHPKIKGYGFQRELPFNDVTTSINFKTGEIEVSLDLQPLIDFMVTLHSSTGTPTLDVVRAALNQAALRAGLKVMGNLDVNIFLHISQFIYTFDPQEDMIGYHIDEEPMAIIIREMKQMSKRFMNYARAYVNEHWEQRDQRTIVEVIMNMPGNRPTCLWVGEIRGMSCSADACTGVWVAVTQTNNIVDYFLAHPRFQRYKKHDILELVRRAIPHIEYKEETPIDPIAEEHRNRTAKRNHLFMLSSLVPFDIPLLPDVAAVIQQDAVDPYQNEIIHAPVRVNTEQGGSVRGLYERITTGISTDRLAKLHETLASLRKDIIRYVLTEDTTRYKPDYPEGEGIACYDSLYRAPGAADHLLRLSVRVTMSELTIKVTNCTALATLYMDTINTEFSMKLFADTAPEEPNYLMEERYGTFPPNTKAPDTWVITYRDTDSL